MKTKNMIWAALSMTAALVMTACSNDDNIVETPATPHAEVKTIPYSVTVSGGDAATTRATVDNDMKTLRFAAGDMLYIESSDRTDLKGILTLKAGDEGKTSGATFEGNISYTGEAPTDNIQLKATLVGTNNENFDIAEGKVNGIIPPSAYYDDVKKAVEEYSYLTGTSTYGEKNFTLEQNAAFLNFEITFEDGTAAGTPLTTVVSSGGGAYLYYSAVVTTKTEGGKVVAKFVLPTYKGLILSGATVKMGDKAALTINYAELDGKVYNVKRTYARTLAEATAGDIGKVVCAAGHLHDAKTAVPTGCTAVGILGKVTETGHGLILALKNATSQTWNTINGWTSVTSYSNTTLKVLPDDAARGSLASYTALGETAVSDWAVAQMSDYDAIFTNLGSTTGDTDGYTYDGNVNAFITTGVGGTAISGNYWSATDYGNITAWYFRNNYWWHDNKTNFDNVRPVLAF